MRTYGRVNGVWEEVNSEVSGDDAVWITTLCQCLLLNLGEDPFYAQYGIPSQQSVLSQIFPTFYVNQTQQQFSPYFASLVISIENDPTPTYRINVLTNTGTPLIVTVPI
jgi:hypothetical protein